MGEPTERYEREGSEGDMESKDKFKRTLTSLQVDKKNSQRIQINRQY